MDSESSGRRRPGAHIELIGVDLLTDLAHTPDCITQQNRHMDTKSASVTGSQKTGPALEENGRGKAGLHEQGIPDPRSGLC